MGVDHNVSAFTSDIVDLLLDPVEVGGIKIAIDGIWGQTFHLDVQAERVEPLRDERVILIYGVSLPIRLKSLKELLVCLTVLRVGKTKSLLYTPERRTRISRKYLGCNTVLSYQASSGFQTRDPLHSRRRT